MTTPFGTNALRSLTKKQLDAKYRQVRAAVLATEYGKKFADEAAFEEFASHFITDKGIVRERDRVCFAFGQLHTALTKTTHQITDETLSWGGFLSGNISHDCQNADEACWALLTTPA